MDILLSAVQARHPAARSGQPAALRGIDLQLARGEAVAVIGPSGAGKTSLVHTLACALKPESGQLRLGGDDPWSLSARALRELRRQLLLAPQTPPLPPRQRVVTAVLAARLPHFSLWTAIRSLVYPVDIPAAHAALWRFDLADKLFDRVDRLSGGERQRVGLARALLSPAALWLVDEPLSALDPARAESAIRILREEAASRGVTLVATLHQVDTALAFFPRIIGMREGQIRFDLPAGEVSRAHLQALYAQHEHELQAPAPLPAEPDVTAPVVMHCR